MSYNNPMDTKQPEQWKPVPSVGGLLEASTLGRIRRVERPLVYSDGRKGTLRAGVLRGAVAKIGYIFVSIGSQKYYAHRLVCEAFHGEPSERSARQTVNHINGDKLDNRPENLEWASYRSNAKHARDTGLNKQHGERCNLTKHSEQFIQAVRNVHAKYHPTYAELGRLFGLRDGHVGQIIKKQTRAKS